MTKIFKNSNLKPAFTLAEILITLTIIGVIAAMVIPNLWQRHFEQEMITKLKKNYNILNNAVALAIRENGPVDEWILGEKGTPQSARNFYNYIKPYLKIQKECDKNSGCFPSGYYKPLFGDDTSSYSKLKAIDSNQFTNKFILKDGTSVGIYGWDTGCSQTRCANIYVDLNNKKGPNRYGIDAFWFVVNKNDKGWAIIPCCTNKAQCTYQSEDPENGLNCAMHVMLNGNMDYLHHDI